MILIFGQYAQIGTKVGPDTLIKYERPKEER
jgi:hypothetical protein